MIFAKSSEARESVFVVTGGGTGIGKSLAQALAARNQSVLIVGRREEPLKEEAKSSEQIEYCVADVSTKAGRREITQQLNQVSTLKGLIHNAGTIAPIAPIHQLDDASWHQAMATNVEAPLFLTQQLSDKLKQARVLNIGSGAAYFPVTGWTAYCVSKAALSMLTRCWQLEQDEIAFASVMPGIIDTDMQHIIRHASSMSDEKRDFFQQLKRDEQLLSPETVALFLCWLLLDVERVEYQSKEWDIYDKNHHGRWLPSDHGVPMWEDER